MSISIVKEDAGPFIRLDSEGRVLLWCEQCRREHLGPIADMSKRPDQPLYSCDFLAEMQRLEAEVRQLKDRLSSVADCLAASELARANLLAAQIEKDCPLPEQAQAVLDATECDR